MQKDYLTEQGLDKVKKEYDLLSNLKKAKISDGLPQAIISEEIDSEYISFFQDINLIDARLTKLDGIIKNAVLIEPPAHEKMGIVSVGATVELESGGQVNRLKIVGSAEADPDNGRISYSSPVGSALLGHKAGDKVAVASPLKSLYYILDVKYQIG